MCIIHNMLLLPSVLLKIYKCKMSSFYHLVPIKLGCEVRGIDLKVENRQEVIEKIKKDVTKHRILIFKDQGIISGDQHVKITKWFGEIDSTILTHPKSPNLDLIMRISNDPEEGYTGIGQTGWHVDGTYQPAPYSHSLLHIVSASKNSATAFAPITDIIEGLSAETRNDLDRLWMISDGDSSRASPIHPLLYPHPETGKIVMCFHLGKTKCYIWDYNTPNERIATDEEFHKINKDIEYEFVKDNEAIQYKHQWEPGDFIIYDNLAVSHKATPGNNSPRSEVGLRILHRTNVNGVHPPSSLKLNCGKSDYN